MSDDPTPDDIRLARRELLALASQMETSESSPDSETGSLFSAMGGEACEKLGLPDLPAKFQLSVVMPVYNERDTVEQIIARVMDTYLPIELVIVDDGSRDGTGEKLQELSEGGWSGEMHPRSSLKVVVHETNRGKGAALRTGFASVNGDVVVIQDADKEYDPQDYFVLLAPILENTADVVYGSRFQQDSDSSSPGWHRFGNRMITRTSNLKTRLKLTDVETCYKMFRLPFLKTISNTLRESGFGIELEMTAKLARIPGIRIVEVPITYHKRTYAEGKKIGWKDGFWALWCILRY